MIIQAPPIVERKLNIGCGKVILPGYVNADLRALPNVDVTFNAFVFPWPFEDNEFDEVYASHLVEHIPHLVRARTGPNGRLEPVWDEDGFFIFFREVWRILKPSGRCVIEGPYHRSMGCDQDPTHTRGLTEATFSYLWQESETFNYELGYKFNSVSWEVHLGNPWPEMHEPG